MTSQDLDRFMKKVHMEPNTGCWLWGGGYCNIKNQLHGYGVFNIKRKNIYAHRFSYAFFKGHISTGLLVCHKCDTPDCVNPEHLFIGSYKDNAMDRERKKRGGCSKKTHCKNGHKFTPENTFIHRRHNKKPSRECKTCLRG